MHPAPTPQSTPNRIDTGCTQDPPHFDPKSTPSRPRVDRESNPSRPRIDAAPTPDQSRTVLESIPIRPRFDPTSTLNRPRIDCASIPNRPRIDPEHVAAELIRKVPWHAAPCSGRWMGPPTRGGWKLVDARLSTPAPFRVRRRRLDPTSCCRAQPLAPSRPQPQGLVSATRRRPPTTHDPWPDDRP